MAERIVNPPKTIVPLSAEQRQRLLDLDNALVETQARLQALLTERREFLQGLAGSDVQNKREILRDYELDATKSALIVLSGGLL